LTVKADLCLGFPPTLGSGANCGNEPVLCAYGYYCDLTSTCSEFIAADGLCNIAAPAGCGPTATCKTVNPGNYICVPHGNPGDAASYSPLAPSCPSPLSLNSTSGTCTGGLVGDYCNTDYDCAFSLNITCVGNKCVGVPTGGYCTVISSDPCEPGSACIDNVCMATTPNGPCWTVGPQIPNNNMCTTGSYCLYNVLTNTSNCVLVGSLPEGAFCGSTGALCANTMRCLNGYCAATRNTNQCYFSFDCSGDEYCTCSGDVGYFYGTCQKNVCIDSLDKLAACVNSTCQFYDVFPSPTSGSVFDTNGVLLGTSYYSDPTPQVNAAAVSYSKSCVLLNCASEYQAYATCSDAFTLTGSFLLVAMFAMITLFLNL